MLYIREWRLIQIQLLFLDRLLYKCHSLVSEFSDTDMPLDSVPSLPVDDVRKMPIMRLNNKLKDKYFVKERNFTSRVNGWEKNESVQTHFNNLWELRHLTKVQFLFLVTETSTNFEINTQNIWEGRRVPAEMERRSKVHTGVLAGNGVFLCLQL